MSRFAEQGTVTTDLGPCQCPTTPHDRDEAVQVDILGWDDVVDISTAQSEGAGRRVMVTRSIIRWNLMERDGDKLAPVPVTEQAVRLIDKAASDALWDPAFQAFMRAKARLPNVPSEESPRLPPEPDTSIPTIQPTAKPTS